jgi:uncharacterized membrane protein
MGTHGAGELFRLELRDGFVGDSNNDGGWLSECRFLDGRRCWWWSASGIRSTTSPDFELHPWVGIVDGGARVPFVAICQPNNSARQKVRTKRKDLWVGVVDDGERVLFVAGSQKSL